MKPPLVTPIWDINQDENPIYSLIDKQLIMLEMKNMGIRVTERRHYTNNQRFVWVLQELIEEQLLSATRLQEVIRESMDHADSE